MIKNKREKNKKISCVGKIMIFVKNLIFNLGLASMKKKLFRKTREPLVIITQIESSVDKNEKLYFCEKLQNLRLKKLNKIIIAHLNIYSIRNKFI